MSTIRVITFFYRLLIVSMIGLYQSVAFLHRSTRYIKLLPMNLSMSSSRFIYPQLNHPSVLSKDEQDRAERCVTFLNQSPEPFHVVQTVINKLQSEGFQEIKEDDYWSGYDSRSPNHKLLRPGAKLYFTRGGSSIVAFTIGEQYQPSLERYKIIGAHTDSPNLKIKPKSKRSVASNFLQLNVECYGGGLWHTWFDRDLSLAGRVIIKTPSSVTVDSNSSSSSSDSSIGHGHQYVSKLININYPILRIPSLCIHLRTNEEREAFKVNKQDHLQPLLCSKITSKLTSSNTDIDTSESTEEDSSATNQGSSSKKSTWQEQQEPVLLDLLTEQLGLSSPTDIVDFDLSVYDSQTAARNGLQGEFLCSARIDNLASCFSICEAFVDHTREELKQDTDVNIMAFFDHEEVGSESNVGAGSSLIQDTIKRLMDNLHDDNTADKDNNNRKTKKEMAKIITSRSFILSVDMAHAVHPNYANKHDKTHAPLLNQGIVIKTNVNQRYATNGITGFLTREMGRRANVNIQEFSVKNDCPCGSTIGPTLSTNTGIRAVDLGMPQLSMHSIREMMGCADLTNAYKLFRVYLKDFGDIDQSFKL